MAHAWFCSIISGHLHGFRCHRFLYGLERVTVNYIRQWNQVIYEWELDGACHWTLNRVCVRKDRTWIQQTQRFREVCRKMSNILYFQWAINAWNDVNNRCNVVQLWNLHRTWLWFEFFLASSCTDLCCIPLCLFNRSAIRKYLLNLKFLTKLPMRLL